MSSEKVLGIEALFAEVTNEGSRCLGVLVTGMGPAATGSRKNYRKKIKLLEKGASSTCKYGKVPKVP